MDTKTGHEGASTEALLVIHGNLINGLKVVAGHFMAGTQDVPKKAGATPPSQFGHLVLALLLGVEDELETRILGFERTIDPKLFSKTL